MSDAAVFKGTFSDFRIVKGRKVVQILVEVPSELANAALGALGGIPDPANPVWVAVARIDPKAAEEPKQLPAPERKRWNDLSPSQQAAIRCAEPEFQQFLAQRRPGLWNTIAFTGEKKGSEEEVAAEMVRHACAVESRSMLNHDADAEDRWRKLDGEFWAWQRGMH